MFGAFKDFGARVKIGSIVHGALEQSPMGLSSSHAETSKVASKIVSNVWDSAPHVFNGSKTSRPHNLCAAAIILKIASEQEQDAYYATWYFAGMSAALSAMRNDRQLLSLTPINKEIIEECEKYSSVFLDRPDIAKI